MRLDHIALTARDPQTLSAWYELWFDLDEERRLVSSKRPPIIFLTDEAGQRIEIVPGLPGDWPEGARFAAHAAFSTLDLDSDMKRLAGAGIRVIERRRTSVGWRIAYFYDPEGNLIEMVQRSPEKAQEGGQ